MDYQCAWVKVHYAYLIKESLHIVAGRFCVNNNIFIETDRPQNDYYEYTTNGWSQVITGVELNLVAAMQGAHHILQII